MFQVVLFCSRMGNFSFPGFSSLGFSIVRKITTDVFFLILMNFFRLVLDEN